MPTLVDPWGGVTQGISALQETLKAIPQMQAAQMTLAEMYENKKIRSEIGIANQEAQAKYQKDLEEYNVKMSRFRPGGELERLGAIAGERLPGPKKPDETAISESVLRKYGRFEEVEKIKSNRRQEQFDTIKLALDAADKGAGDIAKWIIKGSRDLFGDEMPDIAGVRKIDMYTYEVTEEETGINYIITVKRDKNTGEFAGVEKIDTQVKVKATPEEEISREVKTTRLKKRAELEEEKISGKPTKEEYIGQAYQEFMQYNTVENMPTQALKSIIIDELRNPAIGPAIMLVKEAMTVEEKVRGIPSEEIVRRVNELLSTIESMQTGAGGISKPKEPIKVPQEVEKILKGRKAGKWRFEIDGKVKIYHWDGKKVTKVEDE